MRWNLADNKTSGSSFVAVFLLHGSYRVLSPWKSLEICPEIFQTWKKSGKVVKSLEFSCSKLQQVLWKRYFFVFVKSYSISPACLQRIIEKALFLLFLRSLLITYLITLSLGKEWLFWDKVWKKSSILDPKICANPVTSTWISKRLFKEKSTAFFSFQTFY